MWDVKRLDCYWKAIDLVGVFEEIVTGFPKFETYELGSQIRRAVSSISGNMAEGADKFTSKDYIKFLHNATGSCGELENWVLVIWKKKYINEGKRDELLKELVSLKKQIYGVIEYVRKKEIKSV
ncbi:MAG: four helix bundle protein [archaeon]